MNEIEVSSNVLDFLLQLLIKLVNSASLICHAPMISICFVKMLNLNLWSLELVPQNGDRFICIFLFCYVRIILTLICILENIN